MPASGGAISGALHTAGAAILDADKGLSPANRLATLSACDKALGAAPAPAAGVEIPLQDAARTSASYFPAVLRWIEAGKLDWRQFGNRLWLISAASVESMRESLAAPAWPVESLPDRLGHLAHRIPEKSWRG